MIKKNPGLFPAAAIATITLVVGIALIRLGTQQRIAMQRAIATQAATESAESVEQKLQSITTILEDLAAQMAQRNSPDDFRMLAAASGTRMIQDVSLLLIPRSGVEGASAVPAAPAAGQSLSGLEWNQTVASDITPYRGPEWLPPMRSSGGEWTAVVRLPLLLTNPANQREFAGWVAASVPISALLRTPGTSQSASPELDYQLVSFAPDSRRPRILASSTEFDLITPVQQPIHLAQGRWFLLAAPKDGWTSWVSAISQGLLVGLIALFGGLVTYDFARRPNSIRTEIENRDERLRVVHQRLSEEIEQREELERKFGHAASHDAFTGLPNRIYFMDRLGRTLRRARLQPGYVLAVIVLHLERFKTINETLGAAAGDELCTQAVLRLEGCLRPEDLVVARIADDEFGILLFDVTSAQAAAAAAKRLQDALAEPFAVGGQSVFTTGSMGIAIASSGYENAEELVRGAHMALSKAKADGMAQFAVIDSATREQIVSRHQMETDLHQAVERQEFCLHYQPIISLQTGSITGMETLLRWQHPLEGLVPPGRFIPLAEETGLIVPITRWVLREACSQARTWREAFGSEIDFYLSVNLSAQDLRQHDLCDYVASVVSEFSLPPGVLRLEVTESFMIGNLNAVSEIVSRFKKMGIPLLLDDFGTGYSSLSYLNRIHFDYIKIDQAFVSRISAESQNSGIVRAIVHLAADLGSKTIAEGVETSQCLAQLRELGCNYGQGYYFSKPLESKMAEKLLLSRPKW